MIVAQSLVGLVYVKLLRRLGAGQALEQELPNRRTPSGPPARTAIGTGTMA